MSIASQKRTLVQTTRDLAISVLKQYYSEYKKFLFILPDLFIFSVEFLCEIRQEFYENGQLRYRRSYVNNKKHGDENEWYKNGQLRYQHPYENGKLHGEYREWYENDQLWYQCSYINGKQYGEYKSWDKNGQPAL